MLIINSMVTPMPNRISLSHRRENKMKMMAIAIQQNKITNPHIACLSKKKECSFPHSNTLPVNLDDNAIGIDVLAVVAALIATGIQVRHGCS